MDMAGSLQWIHHDSSDMVWRWDAITRTWLRRTSSSMATAPSLWRDLGAAMVLGCFSQVTPCSGSPTVEGNMFSDADFWCHFDFCVQYVLTNALVQVASLNISSSGIFPTTSPTRDLQRHVANRHVSLHMATEDDNNHTAIPLRSAAADSKTPFDYACTSTAKAPWSHRYTAANKTSKRTARNHCAQPFIAGCSHFTRENTVFRGPASSPKQVQCNNPTAITMRFATVHRQLQPLYTEKPCNNPATHTSQHFPKSPLPYSPPQLPRTQATTSLSHHLPTPSLFEAITFLSTTRLRDDPPCAGSAGATSSSSALRLLMSQKQLTGVLNPRCAG